MTSTDQAHLLAYHQTREYDDSKNSAGLLGAMFGGKSKGSKGQKNA